MKIRKSLLYLFCLSLPFNLYGQDWPNFNRYRQDNYRVGMPAENENRIVFNEIVEKINHLDDPLLNDFNLDQQLIDRIFKYASIKHILDNNKYDDYKKLDLLDEIIKDLKTYELEFRIEELESKFSKDLSESTFNEIRELKKLQKTN